MSNVTGKWDGGYIHTDASGRKLYMIRKQVNGVRYEISTRAYSETAAHAQLKLFQANPGAYDPNGNRKRMPSTSMLSWSGIPRLLKGQAEQRQVDR